MSVTANAVSLDVPFDDVIDRLTSEFPVCYLLNAIADNLEGNAPKGDLDGRATVLVLREAAEQCRLVEG